MEPTGENLPLNHTTRFFRESNQADYVAHVAPGQQVALDRMLNIADVGCSTGEETWSIASSLGLMGVRYAIDAYDASSDVLAKASRGWYENGQGILRSATGIARICLEQDFAQIGQGSNMKLVVPFNGMRRNVSFLKLNILEQPLPTRRYDTAIAANLLFHYRQPADRDRIIGNIVNGLKPGGILMLESAVGGTVDGYGAWVNGLSDRFALQAIEKMRSYPAVWQAASPEDDKQKI